MHPQKSSTCTYWPPQNSAPFGCSQATSQPPFIVAVQA